jgi:hypothetical protein
MVWSRSPRLVVLQVLPVFPLGLTNSDNGHMLLCEVEAKRLPANQELPIALTSVPVLDREGQVLDIRPTGGEQR